MFLKLFTNIFYFILFLKSMHFLVVSLKNDQIIWNHVKYFIIHISILENTTLFNTTCKKIHIYMLQRTFKIYTYNKLVFKWKNIFRK
jgi:hypothetical protein